jgi:hypothetical protein
MSQILAASSDTGQSGAVFIWVVLAYIVSCIPLSLIFKKADKSAVAAFVPIWNTIVLLQIVGRPVWWIILLLIPFVNVIILIIVYLDLATAFGKRTGFGIGLILLTWIFMLILGVGSASYQGPIGRPTAA